jgi:hypothetical protein
MLKVLSISTLLVLISTGLSQAGYVVGRDRIVAVEEKGSRKAGPRERALGQSSPRLN